MEAYGTDKLRERGPNVCVEVRQPHALISFRFIMLSLRGSQTTTETVSAGSTGVKSNHDERSGDHGSMVSGENSGQAAMTQRRSPLFMCDRLLMDGHTVKPVSPVITSHRSTMTSVLSDTETAALDTKEEEFVFIPDERKLMKRMVLPYVQTQHLK
jgi:hypothetical protein